MTTPNPVIITGANDYPLAQRVLTPSASPVSARPSNDPNVVDEISISGAGGDGNITQWSVFAADGNDEIVLNGSPVRTTVDGGNGNDLLELQTIQLGGGAVDSFFYGGNGNDTTRLISDAVGVNGSGFFGGEGSDLYELRGGFSNVTIGGAIGKDTVRFLAPGNGLGPSNFSTSEARLGASADLFTDGGFSLIATTTTIYGGGGNDTVIMLNSTTGEGANGLQLWGGDGADFLYGASGVNGNLRGENTVAAGSGHDFVQVFGGNDDVTGGGGSDTLILGDGEDEAFGDLGNDVIFAQSGNNTIDAAEGRDLVLGGTDRDSIYAGIGEYADTLVGGAGADTIKAESGNDLIFGDIIGDPAAAGFNNYSPADILGRKAADNTRVTGVINNTNPANGLTLGQLVGFTTTLQGLAATPVATGNNPAAVFSGGGSSAPVDWSDNGNSRSFLSKTSTSPSEAPFAGNTLSRTANILADDPEVNGTGGLILGIDAEIALANNLADPANQLGYTNTATYNGVNAAAGADQLMGDSGNDTIFGGGGRDTIDGGTNNDVIIGGTGTDRMTGGTGSDIFVQGPNASVGAQTSERATNWTFDWETGTGPDVITDFQATANGNGVIDRIAFSNGSGANWNLANNDNHAIRDFTGSANGDWAANQVVLFRGEWNAASGRFVTSNDGDDALVFKANAGAPGAGWTNGTSPNPMGNQAIVLLDAGNQNFVEENFYGNFV